MKLLFLDDDKNRREVAVKRWGLKHELHTAETAGEAIQLLQLYSYDYVSLDHDLGGKVFVDSGKGTGYEVAVFISRMTNPPPIVIVHSWNFHGAQNMLHILQNVTETKYQRFEV